MGPQEPTSAPYTPPSEVPVAPPVPVQPMQMQINQPTPQPLQAPSPQYPPVQPQPGFQPPTNGSAVGYGMPPRPSKSKKGLLIGLGVGGGVLVLAIVIAVVLLSNTGISKKDYQDANMKAADMASMGLDSSSDFITITYISAFGTQYTLGDAQENLDSYKKLFEEVKSMKAMSDNDIKAAFSDYKKAADEYIKFAEDYLSSAKKVILALNKCTDDGASVSVTGSAVASIKSAVAACKAAMSEGKSVADPDLKKLAEAYYDYMVALEPIIEQASVFTSTNYSAATALRNKMYDAQDAVIDTAKDVNASIKKRYDAADLKMDDHAKLEEVMTKKAS